MMRNVHLFVFDGYADWEPALAVAGINQPTFQREPGRYQVKTVALSLTPMRSMGGVAVLPDMPLDALTPQDSAMLILPGGLGWEQGQHGPAVDVARVFLDADVPVAAICGATAGLARAGLLDARRHTSNALAYLKGFKDAKGAPAYHGADRYEDRPAFRDGALITAAGMAPVEFAREIFKRLDLYTDEVLQAWYDLYKTGHAAHHAQLSAGERQGT
ncbi:MAG: type 1 glutamine amidotransferase family protein [Aquabacterium sp.]